MTRLRRTCLAGLFVLGCSSLTPACGSDPAPTPTPGTSGDIVLHPTTKVLDADALARLTGVSADGTTMTFSATSAAIDAIAVNDVILGGVSARTPHGVMSRVTKVERTGTGVMWTVRQAALTEAIRKGKIVLPATRLRAAEAQASFGEGVHPQRQRDEGTIGLSPSDTVGEKFEQDFTLGFDNYEVSKGVTLGASLGFGFGVDLELTVDETQVTGAFAMTGSQSVTLDVNAKYADEFHRSKKLAGYVFPPIPITIAGVPLVVVLDLSVDVSLDGTTKARLAWSGTENATATIGLSVGTNGVDPIWKGEASAVKDPLQIEGQLDATGRLGLTLTASLNALVASAALHLGSGGYLHLSADTAKDPCWNLSTGVDAKYGVDTKLLGITLLKSEDTKTLFETPIASGPCGLDGFGFTTWANAITPTGYDQQPALALYPDGTFLVGSSGAETSGYVGRYQPDGTPLWERKITGTFAVRDVVVAADGAGWLGGRVGTTEGYARLAADGSPEAAWLLTGATGYGSASYVAAKSGGLLVGGSWSGSEVGWAARVDASGALQWSNSYTGIEPYAIAETSDGGVILFGTASVAGGAKLAMLRLAPDGTIVFARTYGAGRLFGGTALADGGFAGVGSTATGEGAVVRVDPGGELVWGFAYEDAMNLSMDFAGNTVFEQPDGLLIGGARDFSHDADGWLLRVGKGGELIYSRSYGGADEDVFFRMVKTPDEGTLLAGTTASFGDTSALFLMHVLQSGAISFSKQGAFQHNVEAQKADLSGSPATLASMPSPLGLTSTKASLEEWTGALVTAKRTALAE